MGWSNGMAEWVEDNTAFISVAFSWMIPQAYQRAIWYRAAGYNVRVGGGALYYYKNYFGDIAEIGGRVDALPKHNPYATKASEGCPVGCSFCTVPNIEGKTFTFIPEFTPRPILCDNNLSALPVDYQEYIIQKYIDTHTDLVDCNSGFEPKTFTEDTYQRWAKIYKGVWRFAYDELKEGIEAENTARILKDIPAYRKRVYILIGNEPFEACYSRILKVIEWNCQPYVQPLIALNSLIKEPIIRYDWSANKLIDLARWANRFIWRKTRFEDYNTNRRPKNEK